MSKVTRALLLIAVVAALIFGYFSLRPEGKQKVVISQAFQHLLYIGLYVAQDGGFFETQGLDVEIRTAGGDDKTFAALASGDADFAQGDPAFVAIARERGWDGRVVVMAVDRVAIWGVAKPGSSIEPFDDPAGFAGMRVATYPEPNTSYVVQKQLAQRAGLELGTDTEIVQVQFGSELAALEAGTVDIAQTIEPNVTQMVQRGGKVVFSYPEAWGPLAFTGLMVSKETIDERPDLVQKVVNAYEAAFQYIQDNPDGALEIAEKQLPDLDKETIRLALARLIDSKSIPAHAAIDPESWKKLLEIRVEVGDLSAMPDIPLYDNTFADEARN